MRNQAKQLELTNDYNIVNQEWQSFQDPNRQIYDPFTNQLIELMTLTLNILHTLTMSRIKRRKN